MSELTYAGLVEQLFPRLTGGIRWGLERTVRMLAAAGNPERSYATIHVGGTNGKGSVASTMASILRAAGLRTGLYTSPHLCEFTERIQVDGVPVEREVLLTAARRLWPVVQREAPSFFEATTAIAFLTLAQVGVQVAVVEVGLGGRLDSTNVITPDVSVLTNVAMDHAQYLGNTLELIAQEKAGIIKPAVPVVTSEPDPVLRDVFRNRAQEVGAPFHVVDPDVVTDISVDESGTRLIYTTDRFDELALHTPLIGAHQAMNTAVAVEAVSLLPEARRPDVEAVQRGVRTVRWPGRVQIERRPDGVWLFDAAHNPAGVMGDKDWLQMLPSLFQATDRAVLTTPYTAPEGRRWDPDAVLREVPSAGAEVVADFAQALARARELAGSGAVIVTGSFHTVGDALLELGVEPFPPDPGLPPAAAAV
ncbi:MAG: Mur ligase family protein [Gemmatimonadota bacterium]